jgi:hypothetical protein
LDEKLDRLIDDVQDRKHRVTSLEGQVAGLLSGLESIRADMAAMHRPTERPVTAMAQRKLPRRSWDRSSRERNGPRWGG